jgi:transcriptional regulator with XRE-family HTH domain
MPTKLGEYFRTQREQAGLNLNQLARIVGYKNDCKGMNRICKFEREGHVHPDLLSKLMAVLDVGRETVERLVEQDRREFLAEWTAWVNQPIEPYLVVRLMPSIYCRKDIPESVQSIDEAEDYASAFAKQMNCKVYLVLSRRITLEFTNEGVLNDALESLPGHPAVPSMRLGRSRRRFLFRSLGHDLAIEQVRWPGS